MVGQLHQLHSGALFRGPFERGADHLGRPSIAVGAANQPEDRGVFAHLKPLFLSRF
jgi:hypothetical protein